MASIPARDLRNHTAEILRRVESGEEIEVRRDRTPIAKLVPLRGRRRWIPGDDLVADLESLGADRTGLVAQIHADMPDTTDDLAQ